jgi:hypothetical protein
MVPSAHGQQPHAWVQPVEQSGGAAQPAVLQSTAAPWSGGRAKQSCLHVAPFSTVPSMQPQSQTLGRSSQ